MYSTSADSNRRIQSLKRTGGSAESGATSLALTSMDRESLVRTATFAVLVGISLTIGVYGASQSGALWPDSPRYSNAAAMIHDWLTAPGWSNPYRFAQANYAQYPAFNIPFHPPGYPGLLALTFLMAGTSYVVARWFIAGCLGGSACFFAAIQERLGVKLAVALVTALVFVTTPDISLWSRDTMSEIPSLVFILAASYVYLGWLDSGRPVAIWAAFGLAVMALMSRLSSVGVMPCWYLYALWQGKVRRLGSLHLLIPSALYVVLAAGYIVLASKFAMYEFSADGKMQGFKLAAGLGYFTWYVPQVLGWGTTILALAALVLASGPTLRTPAGRFWLCWLVSYLAYKVATPTSLETRHFLGALPALVGLTAGLFDPQTPRLIARRIAPALLGVALALNVVHLVQTPVGLVGYQEVAAALAAQTEPGNVLMACPYNQDLMFRYRGLAPRSRRTMIRSDRTLAIRPPSYANTPAKLLAHDAEGVLKVIRQGHIRYVVTAEPRTHARNELTEEARLTHETVSSRPESFTLIGKFPLRIDFEPGGERCEICVWAFLKELPDGPSELPVVIPTARMVLPPKS